MTDQPNETNNPFGSQLGAEASLQAEKQPTPFGTALRDKARTDPIRHDTYMVNVLNTVADVFDSVS